MKSLRTKSKGICSPKLWRTDIPIVNALKEELGIEPKISWLFEAPTISEFAARIQQEMDSNNYMEDDGEI